MWLLLFCFYFSFFGQPVGERGVLSKCQFWIQNKGPCYNYGFLRASPATSLYFYTVWTVNSDIYLLPIYFFKYIFQQIFYPFSSSFKYYFFHSLFIHILTHVPIPPIPTPFFANFLFCFIFLLTNSSTSSLENDCSLAKNFLSFKEVVGGLFFGFILHYRDYFAFT